MRSAAKSAAFGGVLLAMIEGLGILLTRATAPPPAPPMMDMAPMGAPLPQPGTSLSFPSPFCHHNCHSGVHVRKSFWVSTCIALTSARYKRIYVVHVLSVTIAHLHAKEMSYIWACDSTQRTSWMKA